MASQSVKVSQSIATDHCAATHHIGCLLARRRALQNALRTRSHDLNPCASAVRRARYAALSSCDCYVPHCLHSCVALAYCLLFMPWPAFSRVSEFRNKTQQDANEYECTLSDLAHADLLVSRKCFLRTFVLHLDC